jgi:hypothetical protein
MKNFFTKHRRLVEITLSLVLVFLAAGYYYLIYIPERENEIIKRRFRTLQRIEKNMQEKMQGYVSTIKNCVARGDEIFFQDIVNAYNTEPEKFRIKVLRKDSITKDKFAKLNHDSVMGSFVDSVSDVTRFNAQSRGRKVIISYNWRKLKKDSTITNVCVEALIDYKEFIAPLLRKNVFDHYLVFNVSDQDTSRFSSNVVYEDFPSGISFDDVDSLFDAKEKVYSSRIIKIETGGEKYLAFLHPCGYNRKNERIIAGLLKEDIFTREKQQLPEKMVTGILFIALFTFLLLPVIRLTLMGKKERIRLYDVFGTYFSFLLLIPVVILLVFWNKSRLTPNNSTAKESKEVLANQISQSILSEVDSAYELLFTIDTLHAKDSALKKIGEFNIRYLGHPKGKKPTIHDLKDTINNNDPILANAVSRLDTIISTKLTYNATHYVSWIKIDSGREIASWAFGEDPPRGIYKEREYFKNARDGNELIFLDSAAQRHCVIQPLVSRTDGKFKFVIAKKSLADTLIVASASRFSSVINPVLPMGFDFSITDESGQTIFDSDTTYNLNENLLEEFTNSTTFKSALDTRTSAEFKTRYEDEEHSVRVQPIPSLHYFIVISENTSFESSLNTQCFSFTMMMMFSLFLFICIEILIVLVCHLRKTKLLRNKLDLSWMYPRESMSRKYLFLFVFNTCMLLLLALFCFVGFSSKRIIEYIFLFVMTALISSIAAGVYHLPFNRPEKIESATTKRNSRAIVVLTVLAVIVLFYSWRYSPSTALNVWLFAAVSVGLFFVLKRLKEIPLKNDYLANFRLMVFSKLLLTSGIPVVIFFMCVYNFERMLEERLKLLNYAEAISKKVKNENQFGSVIRQIKPGNGIRWFYNDSQWIADVLAVAPGTNDSVSSYSYTDSTAIRLLSKSRINYNDVSATTDNFQLIRPFVNNEFFFNSIFSTTGNVLTYTLHDMYDNNAKTKNTKLTSSPSHILSSPCHLPSGFVFLLLLAGALLLCYQLLKYVINKIFGIYIPAKEDFKVIQEKLLADERVPYLLVEGMPGGGTTTYIKKQLKLTRKANHHKKYHAIVFDFNGIPDEDGLAKEKQQYEQYMADTSQLRENDMLEMAGNYKVMALPKTLPKAKQQNWHAKIEALSDEQVDCIVFTHLEYGMLNAETNAMKLKLIEKFVYEGRQKIILTCGNHVADFIHGMKKTELNPIDAGNKAGSKKETNEPVHELTSEAASHENINRWNRLLGKFTSIYIGNSEPVTSSHMQNTFQVNELNHPVFLNKYKDQFRDNVKENKTEDKILMIQSLSEQSYAQIWASLTKEEKIVVYDLAADGLVNTANIMPLSMLVNKGLLLHKDGVLTMMNSSFRNFVLTVVNAGELRKLEKEANAEASWSDYKYPVLITLGGLVYFALSSSPEKFGNVLPLVSGLMAGIPTVLKLFSFFKPAESKG